ncbi:MAG: F0F1 ATP synthase subunit delta [Rhodocyclaceae bacterium]|nr:F0F1 ATP synthase subunit delta [Rhodocyclaceae bacterium]
MAELVTIARPYADAAFDLAAGADALKSWSDVLGRLAAIVAAPEMKALINDPKLSADELVKLVLDVAGDGLGEEQQNFVGVLVANERLQLMPEIHALFEDLKNGKEGVKDAVITSAFPLEGKQLKTLTGELEARFKAKLNVTVNVDPELLGGVRIAVGDEVIDASVRAKLASMATALKN